MIRDAGGSLNLWQLNTYWSDRGNWRDVNYRDAEVCYAFWKGELPDDEVHREDYALLLSKQYIRKTEQGYKLNVVWVDSPETWKRVNAAIPDLSKVYASAVHRLYDRVMDIEIENQPKRAEPLVEYLIMVATMSGALVPYVLKHLIDTGKLRPR